MLSPLLAIALFSLMPALPDAKLQEVEQQADRAIQEHRNDDAIELLEKALETNPQWRHGLWRLGSVLYDVEDYAAARPVLERLVQLDPKSGAPWALLGLCEFEMRDYGLALQHLQRGDALGVPAELDLLDTARYHEALLLILMKRFDPAQVLLDHLVQKGHRSDDLLLAQGMVALRIAALPASLHDTASDDRTAIIRRVGEAQNAIARSKPREGFEIYRQLIGSTPNIPNLRLSYAALLVQIREVEAAEAELRAELKSNPGSVEARLRLCALLGDESPGDLVAVAAEAAALDPKSFKAHFFLGKLLFKTEKLQESAKELEISRSLDPSSSMVRFALIRTYTALGRQADARRETEVFERLRAAEDLFHKSGRLPASYFENGKPSPAAVPEKSPAAPVR